MSDPAKDPAGFIGVGVITGAHGVRGVVKVRPYTDDCPALAAGLPVRVRRAGGPDEDCLLVSVSRQPKGLLASIEGVDTRDGARSLTGSEILVERHRLPEPAEGEHYFCDLVGCSVFEESGNLLGSLESIIETGANDVFVVLDFDSGRETLVPDLPWVVRQVDIEAKKIVVDLPEGL